MVAAIVPVKALPLAKGRLSALLTAAERRALVLAMLQDVVAALQAAQTVARIGVISADPAVLAFATEQKIDALYDQAGDLNAALTQAAGFYAAQGARATLVLPADVPLITGSAITQFVAAQGTPRGAAIAPSRDGGTNGLLTWPPLELPFLFGPGSLAQHLAAAQARELPVRHVQIAGLELDVDRPDDLLILAETAGETTTQQLVREWCVAERVMCV